ncbi:uncharacterized protein LOC123524020 isoform X1 [Mercenaria mercenaria]|uniref:uncharacterized protein LOC123524020 isoform X1 n=1 Tax=Mercenaria mercenaria TaxID=6596 RepID=UPI00234EA07C|nr:uncharacterized protein LOC123524020 isoform X1 [Mercenaria mercenaria]
MSNKRTYANAMAEPRRGKTYVCLHCQAVGKTYVEVKYRLTAHVYKHHLALDKAPYYCTLCLMRCTTKSALINHVTKYSRHRLAAAELGATNDGRYLVENPRAAELVCGRDYREISPIEASKLFRSNCRDSVEDFSDQEGEYCHEPAQAVRASPAVSSLPGVSNSTSGLINVQLTPEMLSSLLKNQPLQNNLFHSSLPQATSSEMSVTKPAEVPLQPCGCLSAVLYTYTYRTKDTAAT